MKEFKIASITYLRSFNFNRASRDDLIEAINLLKIIAEDYQIENSEDIDELKKKLTAKARECLDY